MAYQLDYTREAEEQLHALPAHIQKRVARWCDLLAEDPRRPQTKQLAGRPGLRRVHASRDYVIVYTIRDEQVLVVIVRVGHRRDVYRRL